MRLIIDPIGDGHSDIFLKLDSIPSKLIIGDSYYLSDFLELDDAEINISTTKLLNYWKVKIDNLKNGEIVFLPFGLFDEYICGLNLKKSNVDLKFLKLQQKNCMGIR